MPAPHHSLFFTGRMLFLPPNQQRQSTEGTYVPQITDIGYNLTKLLQKLRDILFWDTVYTYGALKTTNVSVVSDIQN